jgi:hypothetical protein
MKMTRNEHICKLCGSRIVGKGYEMHGKVKEHLQLHHKKEHDEFDEMFEELKEKADEIGVYQFAYW